MLGLEGGGGGMIYKKNRMLFIKFVYLHFSLRKLFFISKKKYFLKFLYNQILKNKKRFSSLLDTT